MARLWWPNRSASPTKIVSRFWVLAVSCRFSSRPPRSEGKPSSESRPGPHGQAPGGHRRREIQAGAAGPAVPGQQADLDRDGRRRRQRSPGTRWRSAGAGNGSAPAARPEAPTPPRSPDRPPCWSPAWPWGTRRHRVGSSARAHSAAATDRATQRDDGQHVESGATASTAVWLRRVPATRWFVHDPSGARSGSTGNPAGAGGPCSAVIGGRPGPSSVLSRSDAAGVIGPGGRMRANSTAAARQRTGSASHGPSRSVIPNAAVESTRGGTDRPRSAPVVLARHASRNPVRFTPPPRRPIDSYSHSMGKEVAGCGTGTPAPRADTVGGSHRGQRHRHRQSAGRRRPRDPHCAAAQPCSPRRSAHPLRRWGLSKGCRTGWPAWPASAAGRSPTTRTPPARRRRRLHRPRRCSPRPSRARPPSWQVAILRAGAWTARGLRVPARNALLADVVPPAAYGRAYGFERAMDNLGAIFGPLLAIGLVAAVGTRWAIGLSVIPGLLAALAIVYAIRHTPAAKTDHEPIRHQDPPRPARPPRRLFAGITVFEIGNCAATLLILRATDLLEPGHGTDTATQLALGLYVGYNVAATVVSSPPATLGDRTGAPTDPRRPASPRSPSPTRSSHRTRLVLAPRPGVHRSPASASAASKPPNTPPSPPSPPTSSAGPRSGCSPPCKPAATSPPAPSPASSTPWSHPPGRSASSPSPCSPRSSCSRRRAKPTTAARPRRSDRDDRAAETADNEDRHHQQNSRRHEPEGRRLSSRSNPRTRHCRLGAEARTHDLSCLPDPPRVSTVPSTARLGTGVYGLALPWYS